MDIKHLLVYTTQLQHERGNAVFTDAYIETGGKVQHSLGAVYRAGYLAGREEARLEASAARKKRREYYEKRHAEEAAKAEVKADE